MSSLNPITSISRQVSNFKVTLFISPKWYLIIISKMFRNINMSTMKGPKKSSMNQAVK